MSRRSSTDEVSQPPTGETKSRQSSVRESQEAQTAQQPQQLQRESSNRPLHENTLASGSSAQDLSLEVAHKHREDGGAAARLVSDASMPVEHPRSTPTAIDLQLLTSEHAETSSAAPEPLQPGPSSGVAEGKKRARSPIATDIASSKGSVGSPSRRDTEPPKDNTGSSHADTQNSEDESTMPSKRVKSDIVPWMTQRHKRAIRRSLEASSLSTLSSPPKSSTSVTSTKEAVGAAKRSSPPRS